MKRLFFEKMTLLSMKEKRGLIIDFDKETTILKGENDVGKSSVIKTLLKTFGTQPYKETEKWKKAQVISLVDFDVDGEKFSILHDRGTYAILSKEDDSLSVYRSVTNDLSPRLAEIFDFHLALESRNSSSTQATPAFLFLPFYADQDKSWNFTMDSFERLTQFKMYRRDVVRFHTGIRPNAYYIAKAEKMDAMRLQEEQKRNRDIVMYAVRRVKDLFTGNDFSLGLKDFKKEIKSLIKEGKKLADEEASLKEKIVSLRNLHLAVESQLAIVIRAADELDRDFEFASQELHDRVECPICGAHYTNSVGERFEIAVDEDNCRDLVIELQDEKKRIRDDYEKVVREAKKVQEEITKIDELLTSKKGDISLREVIQSEGKLEVKNALDDDVRNINLKIGELDQEIEDAESRMKTASDRKHAQAIQEFYAEKMEEFLNELAVKSTSQNQYAKIDCTINESGSDGPRALLAYKFAILHTINEFSTSTFCPVVIDSPNQQDQDEDNWTRIRSFIKDRRPDNAQLILGLVDDGDTDFGGTVHEFDGKYNVLQEDYYEECAERLRPMIDAIIKARM